MSAFELKNRIKEALRGGAFGAFQKPVDNERLICSINKSFPGGAVVLIADNDKELCSNLLNALSEKGFRGVVVHDEKAIIQTVREKKFDIIILDMELKVLKVVDIYRKILDIRPYVKVVIATDNKEATKNLVDQTLHKNVLSFLEKPLDFDNLIEVMQNALENRN